MLILILNGFQLHILKDTNLNTSWVFRDFSQISSNLPKAELN